MAGLGKMTVEPLYDSAQQSFRVRSDVRELLRFRGLLKLLIVRDLTVRYKRSLFGVWWTLLNPLLTSLVMWVVFSQVFRFEVPGVPFIVYLLSGVILFTFFSQGLLAVSTALSSSAGVLTKVYVPPGVFPLATGLSNLTNFVISLGLLVFVQVVSGAGVSFTVALVPVLAVALLGFVVGLGSILAVAVVRFHDTSSLLAVVLQLLAYLTPQFYPVSILPEGVRDLIWLNPVYSYLVVFREMMYGDGVGPALAWAIIALTSLGSLALGARTLRRSWKDVAVTL